MAPVLWWTWSKRNERQAPGTPAMGPGSRVLRGSGSLVCPWGMNPHPVAAWQLGLGVTSHKQHKCPPGVPRSEGCGFLMTMRCEMQGALEETRGNSLSYGGAGRTGLQVEPWGQRTGSLKAGHRVWGGVMARLGFAPRTYHSAREMPPRPHSG